MAPDDLLNLFHYLLRCAERLGDSTPGRDLAEGFRVTADVSRAAALAVRASGYLRRLQARRARSGRGRHRRR